MTHLLKNEVENRFPVTATVKVLPTPPHLPRVPRAAVTEERLVAVLLPLAGTLIGAENCCLVTNSLHHFLILHEMKIAKQLLIAQCRA